MLSSAKGGGSYSESTFSKCSKEIGWFTVVIIIFTE